MNSSILIISVERQGGETFVEDVVRWIMYYGCIQPERSKGDPQESSENLSEKEKDKKDEPVFSVGRTGAAREITRRYADEHTQEPRGRTRKGMQAAPVGH